MKHNPAKPYRVLLPVTRDGRPKKLRPHVLPPIVTGDELIEPPLAGDLVSIIRQGFTTAEELADQLRAWLDVHGPLNEHVSGVFPPSKPETPWVLIGTAKDGESIRVEVSRPADHHKPESLEALCGVIAKLSPGSETNFRGNVIEGRNPVWLRS